MNDEILLELICETMVSYKSLLMEVGDMEGADEVDELIIRIETLLEE